jgi:hypothetical protein
MVCRLGFSGDFERPDRHRGNLEKYRTALSLKKSSGAEHLIFVSVSLTNNPLPQQEHKPLHQEKN